MNLTILRLITLYMFLIWVLTLYELFTDISQLTFNTDEKYFVVEILCMISGFCRSVCPCAKRHPFDIPKFIPKLLKKYRRHWMYFSSICFCQMSLPKSNRGSLLLQPLLPWKISGCCSGFWVLTHPWFQLLIFLPNVCWYIAIQWISFVWDFWLWLLQWQEYFFRLKRCIVLCIVIFHFLHLFITSWMAQNIFFSFCIIKNLTQGCCCISLREDILALWPMKSSALLLLPSLKLLQLITLPCNGVGLIVICFILTMMG